MLYMSDSIGYCKLYVLVEGGGFNFDGFYGIF